MRSSAAYYTKLPRQTSISAAKTTMENDKTGQQLFYHSTELLQLTIRRAATPPMGSVLKISLTMEYTECTEVC